MFSNDKSTKDGIVENIVERSAPFVYFNPSCFV